MVTKDGITQTDVKSLFLSYNGHLNFYKDVIQDGYQKLLYKHVWTSPFLNRTS